MHPLLQDPEVAAEIDAVVARYRRIWTDEQAEAFREQMAEALASHPRAFKLLYTAFPRLVYESSELPCQRVDQALAETERESDRRSTG